MFILEMEWKTWNGIKVETKIVIEIEITFDVSSCFLHFQF